MQSSGAGVSWRSNLMTNPAKTVARRLAKMRWLASWDYSKLAPRTRYQPKRLPPRQPGEVFGWLIQLHSEESGLMIENIAKLPAGWNMITSQMIRRR